MGDVDHVICHAPLQNIKHLHPKLLVVW